MVGVDLYTFCLTVKRFCSKRSSRSEIDSGMAACEALRKLNLIYIFATKTGPKGKNR